MTGGQPNPPRSVDPLVSVVIVTYGDGHLLTGCLRALREHTREPHEVIVLDSASPDGTGDWAARALTGVTVRRSDRNLGYGALSNAGVLEARAPYVCLLNADVTVGHNWLPPLLDVLENDHRVAAVAPLMRNPDGTVQECGSVVDSEGWSQAWTGEELGEAPVPPFRRAVDYASGACLLVRRGAFNAVGGFAPEYEIAYFEDVDLAFKLRQAGWTTMVEPRSVVVHQRHGASGSKRAEQLMRHNHGTFVHRWGAELRERAVRPASERRPHEHAHARDVAAVERVLVIDDRVPNADRGSGDPRTHRLIEALTAADRVVTLLARDGSRAQAYAPWLLERGVEVVWAVDPDGWLANRTGCYDVVIVSRPHNWEWAAEFVDRTQPQAVRIYDAEALFHRRMEQLAETDSSGVYELEAQRLRTQEAEAFRWADIGFCITRQEQDWAHSVAPDTALHLIGYPAGISDPMRGFHERAGVAFFGGFMAGPGSPNEYSVLELAEQIWPRLGELHPELGLTIVGADPTPAVQALAGDRVHVVGRVPDPAWWLDRALLHIAPMRYGAGLKLKFVESMAAGLPFLTTPLGAEGLQLGALADFLVASSPAETVEQADRLLGDSSLWTDVHDRLIELVEQRFSVEQFNRSVDAALLRCGLAPAVR